MLPFDIITMSSMFTLFIVVASLGLATFADAQRVLGAYIFQRHGDRTPKILPPTLLTDLGYQEVFMTGQFFRDRYISPSSALQIEGISPQIVNLTQVLASAPVDDVIENSGQAFLQGLYPPAGNIAHGTLRNGSTIQAPMNGYQLIPMATVQTGSGSENNPWLESTTSCNAATQSSNEYYYSAQYQNLLGSTRHLYESLAPLVEGAFSSSELNFKNAYTIWDLLNVAFIHNSTSNFNPAGILSNSNMHELLVLANTHEYNLAYNASSHIRGVAGMTLAGQVLAALNSTITSGGSSKLNVQFGSYATFLSYFGLTSLPNENPTFYGMPLYSSSMVWELVTNAPVNAGWPSESDINVRFWFHNGTSIEGSTQLQQYPLFGQPNLDIPWSEFVARTQPIAITSQQQWCQVCGNTTGICAPSAAGPPSSDGSFPSSSSHGMSLGDAGVIGAMVTLGVLGLLIAIIMFVFKLRLVKKGSGAVLSTAASAEKGPSAQESN